LSADEAVRLGILDAVHPDADSAQAAALAALGPCHVVAITLARRLLLESAETCYEDAVGNFLAAQHRAISQPAFLDTLKKERPNR
jgi:enoyl-CoA hydratase/carnithine racemase